MGRDMHHLAYVYNHFDTHEAEYHDVIFNHCSDTYIDMHLCVHVCV